MSKSRLMRKIRRQDYYRPMLRSLRECGVSEFKIVAPRGCGHPILHFHNGRHEVRLPLPSSPSGGSKLYVPREIRRSFRASPSSTSGRASQ